jgi:hypothetical protein
LLSQLRSKISYGNGFDTCFDLALLPRFFDIRLMIESQIKCRQSSWGVPQGRNLCDASIQNNVIHTLQ